MVLRNLLTTTRFQVVIKYYIITGGDDVLDDVSSLLLYNMTDSKLEASYKALHQKIWVDQHDIIFEDRKAQARYAKVKGVPGGVMMIRGEYLKLWDFVQKDHAQLADEGIRGGLVITGQPGIGKSSLLNIAYPDA
jgi:hypothetical protein